MANEFILRKGLISLGGITFPYKAISGVYTIGADDYMVDCTTNTFSVTLPTAALIQGKIYAIKNSGSGTITVATTSSQTIDGATTKTLSQYQILYVESNGANWIATGPQGNKGGLLYKFNSNTTSTAPASGEFKFNNATIGSITTGYISDITNDGADVGVYLNQFNSGGYMIIQSNTNGDPTYAIFLISSSGHPTGFVTYSLTYISGSLPSNVELCVISFSKNGLQGVRGVGNWTPGFTGGVTYGENSNTFYKSTGNDDWDGGVYSTQGYVRGCYVSWQAIGAAYPYVFVGLSSNPTANASYTNIDYAWYLQGASLNAQIWESGTGVSVTITYSTSTVFEITYDGLNIRYWATNNLGVMTLYRTVSRSIGNPLYLDSSFFYQTATDGITNCVFGPMGEAGATGPGSVSGTLNYLSKFTPNGTSLGNSVVVENTGNIGIGTATPGSKLSVGERASADGNLRLSAAGASADAGASLLWDMYVGGGNPISHIAEIRPESYATGVQKNLLNFYVGAWNNNADSGTPKMTITETGTVGIGTINPQTKLDVSIDDNSYGTALIVRNTNAGSAAISQIALVTNTYTAGFQIRIFNSGGAVELANYANSSINFLTNATEKMRIHANGKVSINNTDSTAGQFSVSNDASVTAYNTTFRMLEGGTFKNDAVVGWNVANQYSHFGNYQNFPLSLRTNDQDRIWIANSGNIGIGTTGPSAKLNVKSTGGTATTSTLFTDPYTRLSGSGIPAGGTPSVTYTTISGASSVTQIGSGAAYAVTLSQANVYNTVTSAWPVFPAVNYSTILNANTATLQWTVNAHQTLNGTMTGFTSGGTQTGQAIVLACSGTNPSSAGTSGYALAFGVPGTGNTWSLIYFTNGLNGTGAINILIGPSAAADPRSYFSLKVTYTPIANQWTFYYRADALNSGTWANPLTGTYTTVGTASNSTLTGISLPYFSFVYNAQTGNGHFSNLSLTTINTLVYPDSIKSEDGNIRQTNGFSILENLTSVDAASDAAAAALNVPLYGLYRTGTIVKVRVGGTTSDGIVYTTGAQTIDGVKTFVQNVTAPGFFNSSDARLKNVTERDGDTVKFTWKDKRDDKTHIGYIAQEVQEKYPDQVNEDADGLLTVNYIEVLVAKIQELENRIKILENK